MNGSCLPVRRRGGGYSLILASLTAGLLGGCATLPSSGPTGVEVRRAAQASDFPFSLIEVTSFANLPPALSPPRLDLAAAPPQPTDLLGPGDVLNITVYEAGVALFGRSAVSSAAPAAAVGMDTSASGERLPATRIDDRGYIRVPFVGLVRAAGRTASELAIILQRSLRGISQDPQVVVSVEQSITNSIMVAGEVARPGRLVLATNRETLVDAIALAGGYKGEAKDAVARVQRQGRSFELRLSDLLDLPQQDFQIAPGDRITLVRRPQSFSALGAANRAEEIVFPRGRVSLAEAVALAGGVNPNQGDAAAIFVFRYVRRPDGTEAPTVYRLNMMRPGAYLLSQRFMMRDRDVLYVGNARANQVTKFVQLLSQLFVPVSTVRATVR